MHKAALTLLIFALVPPLVAFGLAPAIGVLDLEGISPLFYIYVVSFYAPIILAIVIFLALPARFYSYKIRLGNSKIFYVLLGMSLLYLAVATYDVIINRNIFTLGISGSWKASVNAGARSSAIGATIMLTSGAPTILFCCTLFNSGEWGNKFLLMILACTIFLLSTVAMLIFSSRNSAFISFIFCFIVIFIRSILDSDIEKYRELTAAKALKLLSLFCLFAFLLAFSLWIFIDRATATTGSIDQASNTLFMDYNIHSNIEPPSSDLGRIVFYVASRFEFYITHPMGYFSEYLNREYCPSSGGVHSFYGVFRIVDFVFGTNFVSAASEKMLLFGVYLSFPGFLYLDFCETSIVVGWIFGISTVLTTLMLFRGWANALLLSAFLLNTYTFGPFYSLPSTGNGFSLMLFAIASVLCKVFHVDGAQEHNRLSSPN